VITTPGSEATGVAFTGKAFIGKTFGGKVWKFGDDINTDLVIPNFAVLMPLEEQLQHCFSANRPGWVDEMEPGDVLVAGRNFGVGSARNIGAVFHALGISGVVADSFNGLGLRNCINSGLPSLRVPACRPLEEATSPRSIGPWVRCGT
jgi:3-isopropylmalate/(R)-2-methylmalate dehydratase small subunit